MNRRFSFGVVIGSAWLLAGCNGLVLEAPAPSIGPELAIVQDDVVAGERHFAKDEFALAALSFQKAVLADPARLEAWLGLAASYDEVRRFDLADRAYAKALSLSGGSATVLNNHGYSYFLRGDVAKARRLILQARALEPANPAIENNLRLVGG